MLSNSFLHIHIQNMIPVFKFIVMFLWNIWVFLCFNNISQIFAMKKIKFLWLVLNQRENIKQDVSQNRCMKTSSGYFLLVWYCSNRNHGHFQFLNFDSVIHSGANIYIHRFRLKFPMKRLNIWLILFTLLYKMK